MGLSLWKSFPASVYINTFNQDTRCHTWNCPHYSNLLQKQMNMGYLLTWVAASLFLVAAETRILYQIALSAIKLIINMHKQICTAHIMSQIPFLGGLLVQPFFISHNSWECVLDETSSPHNSSKDTLYMKNQLSNACRYTRGEQIS